MEGKSYNINITDRSNVLCGAIRSYGVYIYLEDVDCSIVIEFAAFICELDLSVDRLQQISNKLFKSSKNSKYKDLFDSIKYGVNLKMILNVRINECPAFWIHIGHICMKVFINELTPDRIVNLNARKPLIPNKYPIDEIGIGESFITRYKERFNIKRN